MRRSTLNFIIDSAALIFLLGLGGTGCILKWILPPGSGGEGQGAHGGRGGEHIKALWSLGRHDWGDIHFYLAICFLVLMGVHIFLHWGWIKGYLKSLYRPE